MDLFEAVVRLTAKGKDAVLGDMAKVGAAAEALKKQGGVALLFGGAGFAKAMAQAEALKDPLKAAAARGGEFGRAWDTTLAAASLGFGTLAGSVLGFVHASSPDHWNTLTGSISLLAGSIGELFLPIIEQVIDFVQDADEWFRNLDDATKANIVTWTLWAGAALAFVVVLPKVIALIKAGAAVVALLSGGLKMLAVAALGAGKALMAFALSNPFTAILAGVAAVTIAVLGLRAAFGSVGSSVADLAGRLDSLEGILGRIRSGEAVSPAEVRQVLPEQLRTRLAEAGGSRLRQRQILGEFIAEQRAAGGETPRENEVRANAAERAARRQAELNAARGDPVRFAEVMSRHLAENARPGESPADTARRLQAEGSGAPGRAPPAPAAAGDAVRAADRQTRAAVELAEEWRRSGVPEGALGSGRRPRLTDVRFNSQIHGGDTAWRSMLTAANSLSGIQQEQMRREAIRRGTLLERNGTILEQIRDRLPGGSAQPGTPETSSEGTGGDAGGGWG